MDYSKEDCYDLFCQAISKLERATAFTCERNTHYIVELMSSIDSLRAFSKRCSKGYDLEEDVQQIIESRCFSLPRSNRQIVADVTYMLFLCYRRKLSLFDAINNSYLDVSAITTKYAAFCETVLEPYKKAFSDIFLYDDSAVTEETSESEIKTQNKKLLLEELLKAKEEVMNIVGETSANKEECEQIRFIMDSMYEAVHTDNVRMLKLGVLCMNSIFAGYKRLRVCSKNITEKLSKYSII